MFANRGLSFLLQSELRNILSFPCKILGSTTPLSVQSVRSTWNDRNIDKPQPGTGAYYRRDVFFPEKYTLEPVPYRNLGGRDPVTGRRVVKTLGGGIRHPYLWVDYKRVNPQGAPPLVEKVLEIIKAPIRTAHIALVGAGNNLRYIIATENMKAGDLITTSSELTRSAVRAKEGDAHPLGSLPLGTKVCCVEVRPGDGCYYARAAGTQVVIVRKTEDKVVIMLSTKHEHALSPLCMAVVGRVSNVEHSSIPIGSANALRLLGYRPRSGLWKRKTGKHGRKIRAIPPTKDIKIELPEPSIKLRLTLDEFPFHGAEIPHWKPPKTS